MTEQHVIVHTETPEAESQDPPQRKHGADHRLVALAGVLYLVTFATVLYRARLVPRIIPLVGLIGAPLLIASALGTVLGVLEQVSATAALLALPIALWEFSIGVWLIVRGVRQTHLENLPGPSAVVR